MGLLIEVGAVSLLLLGAICVLVQYAALWIGARLGARSRARHVGDGDPNEGVGIVVGSLLGLLAFALGLTISIAESRFEERRRVAVDEANAIGTAWLRAHAVGGEHGQAVARELETYTRRRIEWMQAPRNDATGREAREAAEFAQAVVWGHAVVLAQQRPDPIVAQLLASLNEVIDLSATQRWAFRGQIPPQLPLLLLALTVAGVAGIGVQWGLKGLWHPWVAMLLLSGWSACLVLIVDFASPRLGDIRVDVSPYVWTLESFAGGIRLPAR
jgi:hypothetical protein